MKRLLVFVLLAAALLLVADIADADKAYYNTDYINTAYQRAFGRNATAAEIQYWSEKSVRDKFLGEGDTIGKAVENVNNKLVTQIKKWLGMPEGAAELQATIERSYKAAFNRLPTPEEFAYWQKECKAKNMGYEDLIRAHQKWEQTGVKADERLAMVRKAYTEVYGREPVKKEIDYWMADIPKKGIVYDQLCNYLKDWVSGNSREQIQELEGVIKRAYAKASVNGPNPDQTRAAMSYVTSKRPFFPELVQWVKTTNKPLNVQVTPPPASVKVPARSTQVK